MITIIKFKFPDKKNLQRGSRMSRKCPKKSSCKSDSVHYTEVLPRFDIGYLSRMCTVSDSELCIIVAVAAADRIGERGWRSILAKNKIVNNRYVTLWAPFSYTEKDRCFYLKNVPVSNKIRM